VRKSFDIYRRRNSLLLTAASVLHKTKQNKTVGKLGPDQSTIDVMRSSCFCNIRVLNRRCLAGPLRVSGAPGGL